MKDSKLFRWLRISDGWFPAQIVGQHHALLARRPSCVDEVNILEYGPEIRLPLTQPSHHYVEPITRPRKEFNEVQVAAFSIPNFVEVVSQRPKDCGVVVLANIASISYLDAKCIGFHSGWSSTKGINLRSLVYVLEKRFGLIVAERKRFSDLSLEKFKASGTFLIFTPEHVMPYINGVLLNVVDNGSRIKTAFEIGYAN